ncbi:MAG: M36 family metallopeptidase [Nannocystaceae bacterium]
MPSLLWAAGVAPARSDLRPAEAARAYLTRLRGLYDAPQAVIDGAEVRFVHDTGRGPIVVSFRQRVGDVEVFHGDVKVLLSRAGELLAIAGSLHPQARSEAARTFTAAEAEAIAIALRDLYGRDFAAIDLGPSSRAPRAGSRFFDLAPASSTARGDLRFREPARVRPTYFPLGDTLVPAHLVELQSYLAPGRPLDVALYAIAADDGRVLLRRDLTAADAFTYRVWAEADGDHRPFDGPLQDFTPHPTGLPDVGPTESVKPVYVTVEGLNHNAQGEADPWLPKGALESVGNNVDAYVDHKNPSGYNPEDGEFRASVTEPGIFDMAYDLGEEPLASPVQSQAALVELFFMVNWLHDWWYDSGLNEGAGNAQADNYGRGGVDGDPIHAEGQDGALEGSINNANMATPTDGASPVMQMYLWSPAKNEGILTVSPGDVDYAVSKAKFGPLVFDVSAPIALIEDGEGDDVNDGCEAPKNDISGKIALVHRGQCTFETKVAAAQSAGAVGVIVANHMDDGPPGLGNDAMVDDPEIPTLGVSLGDGKTLADSLGPETIGHMVGTTDVTRDGTIDNMVIAHEFGHYVHHRLENCGNSACRAMSEGWADFDALLMMLREGDPLDATYAVTTYAGFDPYAYFGIRRVPYSVDTAKNALSFRHIADGEPLPDTHPIDDNGIANSEVHNAGEIWCTMLWEAYIALHKAHAGDLSFAEVRRLMADYVVLGMMMTPDEATWTEQRDGLLLAIAGADSDDFYTFAEAFARRGAGSCAIAPPRDSTDFVGVVEDFQLQANGTLVGFTLDDSVTSCDGDGVVDGGEVGRIHVDVANGGAKPLPAGAVVEVVSPTESLLFPGGNKVALPALSALEKTSIDFDVGLVKGLDVAEHVTVKVQLTTPEGCSTVHELALPIVLNGDVAADASATDDVEVPTTPWSIAGANGGDVWARQIVGDGHAWMGRDLGRVTDASLVSPVLQVSPSEPLRVTFEHVYQFEFSDNTYWDGGVIEVTSDGGATWRDVAELVSVPYNATLMSDANPLNGRIAFGDHNPSYPAADAVSLDFGTGLAGKAVQIRFRIGTDSGAGAPGWQIDDIAVTGITNAPFSVWVADNAACAGEETTGGGATDGDGETDDSATTATTATTAGAGEEDGCSCRAGAGGSRLAVLGLLLVGLGARRRRA